MWCILTGFSVSSTSSQTGTQVFFGLHARLNKASEIGGHLLYMGASPRLVGFIQINIPVQPSLYNPHPPVFREGLLLISIEIVWIPNPPQDDSSRHMLGQVLLHHLMIMRTNMFGLIGDGQVSFHFSGGSPIDCSFQKMMVSWKETWTKGICFIFYFENFIFYFPSLPSRDFSKIVLLSFYQPVLNTSSSLIQVPYPCISFKQSDDGTAYVSSIQSENCNQDFQMSDISLLAHCIFLFNQNQWRHWAQS